MKRANKLMKRAIIPTVTILIAVASLVISLWTLNEHRRISQSQVYLDLQKIGLEATKFSDATLYSLAYKKKGLDAVPKEMKLLAIWDFSNQIQIYNMAYMQYTFGNIRENDWEFFRAELCRFVTSEGGKHFFGSTNLEGGPYSDGFNKVIKACLGNGTK